ncbi:MAG: tRNA (guanosine(37)-N1)-methyltransferase TrmD [Eubacteriales bacterium]|nr:tRNA (guanosine(37)-N1)-methyltransferase TrmD [Eubacteriales bacterium]
MNFEVMTLFPEMFDGFKSESIIKRAIENQIININLHNIRDYSKKKSKSVDDYIFGGSQGMLLDCESVVGCYRDIINNTKSKHRVIYLSPKGKQFTSDLSSELSKEESIILLCGHYEGIDERALNIMNVEEISIGDYILTGGEVPAMVLIDSISRFVRGVLHNDNSPIDDSFTNNLLEEEQYTRPREFEGLRVPEILLSGDHKKIKDYKNKRKIEITKTKRPDLYQKYLKEINTGGKDEYKNTRD